MTVESTPLTTTRGEMLRTTANGNGRLPECWTTPGGPSRDLADKCTEDDRVRRVVGHFLCELRIRCGSVNPLTLAPIDSPLGARSLADLNEADFIEAIRRTERKANDFELRGSGLDAMTRTRNLLAKLESLRG